MNPSLTRIEQLTSLRFVAAFLVLAHHFLDFEAGYAGVTFFYVLSGFILARNYAGRIGKPSQRREFWLRRFARIYPTHLLTFLLAVPLTLHLDPVMLAGAGISNILLLHALIPSWTAWFSFNAVSWTISSEAFFYALFPWLSGWMARRPVAKAGVAVLVVTTLATAWSVATHATLDDTATRYLFYIAPFLRIAEFIAGVAIAMRADTVRRQFGTMTEFCVAAFAIVSVSASYVITAGAFRASLIFLPASVALVAVFASSGGIVTQLLRHRMLVLLGEASFMLYMIHWLVREYLGAVIPASLGMLISILSSIALHFAFERPARDWITRRFSPRSLRASA